MRIISLLIGFSLLTLPSAIAGEALSGPVKASVERVIDGDTVKMRAYIWVDQELIVSVRVAGIDAPELFRPKCAAEKLKARAAKAFVEEFLAGGEASCMIFSMGNMQGALLRPLKRAAKTSALR